jgi:hypothetical protein
MQVDKVLITHALGRRAQKLVVTAWLVSELPGSRWEPDESEQPSRVTLREIVTGYPTVTRKRYQGRS